MRRHTRAVAATAITVLTVVPGRPASAQQRDLSAVEIKVTPVAGSVYMLEGAGGNMAVSAGPDGFLLVDDEFAPLSDKIRAAMATLGTGELKYVLNTHWHGDHTGSNAIFGREVPIIAHENVRKRLQEGMQGERTVPPAPPEALPVVTMADSLSIHFNGEEIKVIHFPNGHTDGDCVIFFPKSNVVHMGDLYFAGRFPVVDLASGGDVDNYMNDVQRVIGRLPSDAKVIPGHGKLGTVADLRAFHRMLMETSRIVRKQLMNQKTLEEIEKQGLPDEWKSWSSDVVDTKKWIEIVYRSVEKKGLPTRRSDKTEQ